MLNRWQNEWTHSDILNKFKPLVKEYETSFRKNRKEEITLARLRSGATFITHMEPYMIKNFPPHCHNCRVDLDIEHMLLNCMLYRNERQMLINKFRQMNLRFNIINLLADKEDIIVCLMKFLHDTNLIDKI